MYLYAQKAVSWWRAHTVLLYDRSAIGIFPHIHTYRLPMWAGRHTWQERARALRVSRAWEVWLCNCRSYKVLLLRVFCGKHNDEQDSVENSTAHTRPPTHPPTHDPVENTKCHAIVTTNTNLALLLTIPILRNFECTHVLGLLNKADMPAAVVVALISMIIRMYVPTTIQRQQQKKRYGWKYVVAPFRRFFMLYPTYK